MLVQGCIALFNLQSFSRDIQNRATAVSLVYSLFKVCVIIIQAVMSRECQADRPLWNNLWQGSLKPSDIFNWCGLQTAANYSNGNSEFNGHLSVSVLMFVSHLLSGYVSYMFWRCIVQFWMASTECLTGCGLAFTSWTHLRAGSGQTAPHSPSCAGKMVTVLFLFFPIFSFSYVTFYQETAYIGSWWYSKTCTSLCSACRCPSRSRDVVSVKQWGHCACFLSLKHSVALGLLVLLNNPLITLNGRPYKTFELF